MDKKISKESQIIIFELCVCFAIIVSIFLFLGFGIEASMYINNRFFDNENMLRSFWIKVIFFRLIVYVFIPIIPYLINRKLLNNQQLKKIKPSSYYEKYFFGLSIISAIYLVLSFDILREITIFSASDAYFSIIGLFLASSKKKLNAKNESIIDKIDENNGSIK